MIRSKRLLAVLLIPLVLGVWVSDVEAKKKKKPRIATGPMDEGRLDPFWIGEGLEFRESDEIDYLWVKEGFSLDGHTLHFTEWAVPEFLGEDAEERDENDHRLARMMASDMADPINKKVAGNRSKITCKTGLPPKKVNPQLPVNIP